MKRTLVIMLEVAVAFVVTAAVAYIILMDASPFDANPKITLTYSSKYGYTEYSNYNTYILVYINATATEKCQLYLGDLAITCDGQLVTPIIAPDPVNVDLYSDQINEVNLSYVVQGEVLGHYQLVYNGALDVNLVDVGSVQVQG